MKGFWPALLRIGFVASVTTLAWFNISASVMAVCAVILVALVGKLESLVEFSFGPLKAKIERNLSESEKLLGKLKAFAAVQARAANAASVATGRFASGDDWIFQSVKRVEAGLRELGASDEELRSARQDFVRLTIRDAASAAVGNGLLPMHLPEEARTEWRELMSNYHDPDAVEAYLSKWGELSDDRKQRIEDMKWMIEHEDVQDSEQYMRAHTAVKWRGHP